MTILFLVLEKREEIKRHIWRLEELLGRKIDLVYSTTVLDHIKPYIEKDILHL